MTNKSWNGIYENVPGILLPDTENANQQIPSDAAAVDAVLFDIAYPDTGPVPETTTALYLLKAPRRQC